jgi:hypothetical protein
MLISPPWPLGKLGHHQTKHGPRKKRGSHKKISKHAVLPAIYYIDESGVKPRNIGI